MITTEAKRLSLLLFYAYVLALAFFAFQILRPFLTPLAWAGILALCLWPLRNKLAVRMGKNRAAFVVTLMAIILIMVPALWLGYSLVTQASQVVMDTHAALMRVENVEKIRLLWERVSVQVPLPPMEELRTRITDGAGALTSVLAGQAAGIVQNVAAMLLKTGITFLALFFFLRDGDLASAFIRNFLPFSTEQQSHLIKQTRDLIYSGLTATLMIAFAQGCLGGLIFAILGLKAAIFWGVCMAFCAMIPVVGTSLIWGPAVVLLMIEGEWGQGVILLVCGIGVIGMLDNILRPILLHGKVAMNGLLLFLSILGGIVAFGFIGLILGPVVMAAAVSLMGMLKLERGSEPEREEELIDGNDN
jgi:predicted PurR-regulated permease PerM